MAPEHCSSLHGFLLAIPLIDSLHEMRPPLEGKTLEESAMSAKKREGYEECLANILALANQGATAPIKSAFVDISLHDQPVPREAA